MSCFLLGRSFQFGRRRIGCPLLGRFGGGVLLEGSMNGFLLRRSFLLGMRRVGCPLLGRFGDGVGGEHEWFSP